MAGWFEREPVLEEIDGLIRGVAEQMQHRLDNGEFLEELTFTAEVDWKLNPVTIKRSMEERFYNAGVQVEIDIYPVGGKLHTDLMVVCVGTMGPNPMFAVTNR